MLVTIPRGEAVENAENGKNSRTTPEADEDGENPRSSLTQVLCIRYPINFGKKFLSMLFDLNNKFNTIHLTFAIELGLFIRQIDVEAQKIDNIVLYTYEIVVATFSVMDKANRVRFLEKTFLMANISPEVVFGILFLILIDMNIDFLNGKLQ